MSDLFFEEIDLTGKYVLVFYYFFRMFCCNVIGLAVFVCISFIE